MNVKLKIDLEQTLEVDNLKSEVSNSILKVIIEKGRNGLLHPSRLTIL